MAIGLVVLFFEGALVELFQTERTHKMFGVKLSEHGRDAPPRDGFVAAGAERAPFGMVVGLAVGLTFVVVERAPVERLPAVPTDKAVGMPLTIQS